MLLVFSLFSLVSKWGHSLHVFLVAFITSDFFPLFARYTDDGAVEDQFNQFAKSLLIDGGLMGEQGEQREQREQGTKEMG